MADNKNQHLIDVVITWVDGNDPLLAAKRQQFLKEDVASDAKLATRFASNDEIYFAIASVLKYLPDCGKIYVVTDQQQPAFLSAFASEGICSAGKIEVIDHTVLFQGYTDYLPVFNSLSIETMLWNIPNLSNQFIYLNDDVFLNAPVRAEDCFVDDKVVIYGHWKSNLLLKTKYLFRKFLNRTFGKVLQPRFTIAQMLSADLVGLNQHYELDHRPHFVQVDILRHYFKHNQDLLNKQIGFKFRDFNQFLPVGLLNHLSIQQNRAVLKDDIPVAYIKPHDDLNPFLDALENPDIQYGCIQSLDEMCLQNQNMIREKMIEKLSDVLPSAIKQRVTQ